MLSTRFYVTTAIILTICVFGLIGNILCAVVLFSKQMNRSSYIYLLQGLTIADTCLLSLSGIRQLGNLIDFQIPRDSVLLFFYDWISSSSSKWFTVGISIERFVVITFPFLAYKHLTKERARLSAFGLLAFTISLSGFSYIYKHWIDPVSYYIYVAVVLNFLPLTLVLVFNFMIFLGLRKMRREREQLQEFQQSKNDEYNITKMLFISGLAFGLCFSFEFVRRIMNFVWPAYMSSDVWWEFTINNLSDIFYVLNSSVNFVIYCVVGKKFRAVFCKVFSIGTVTSANTSSASSGKPESSGSIASISTVNESFNFDVLQVPKTSSKL